jgi:hypothetical protein
LSEFYLAFFRLSLKGTQPSGSVRYVISEMAAHLSRDGFSRLWRREAGGLVRLN